MAKTEDEIKASIKNYIDQNGADYPSWYVGIAENPRDRLITGHNVDIDNDPWIFSTAESTDAARRIEQYFVKIPKTDGGTGGGDENTCCVYSYKKSSHTDP